jgi:hypothetical protein
MHFVRKSVYTKREQLREGLNDGYAPNNMNSKNKKKHVTLSEAQVDEFDNEDFIFKAPAKYLTGNEDDSQYFESLDELGFRL